MNILKNLNIKTKIIGVIMLVLLFNITLAGAGLYYLGIAHIAWVKLY